MRDGIDTDVTMWSTKKWTNYIAPARLLLFLEKIWLRVQRENHYKVDSVGHISTSKVTRQIFQFSSAMRSRTFDWLHLQV